MSDIYRMAENFDGDKLGLGSDLLTNNCWRKFWMVKFPTAQYTDKDYQHAVTVKLCVVFHFDLLLSNNCELF